MTDREYEVVNYADKQDLKLGFKHRCINKEHHYILTIGEYTTTRIYSGKQDTNMILREMLTCWFKMKMLVDLQNK